MARAKQTARQSARPLNPLRQIADNSGLRWTYPSVWSEPYYKKRDLEAEEASQPESLSRTRSELSEPPESPTIPLQAQAEILARTKETPRENTDDCQRHTQLATNSSNSVTLFPQGLQEEELGQPGQSPETQRPLSGSPEVPSIALDTRDSKTTRDVGDMRVCGRQAWMLMEREKRHEAKKEEVKVEKKAQPMPPSRSRGRRLSDVSTPPLTRQRARLDRESATALSRYVVDKQESCMLLNKLPLELREEIFGLVLGIDPYLHLISRVQRVGHVRCPEKSWYPHLSDCQCSTTIRNATYLTHPSLRNNTKVSHIEIGLLQTCRHAYREGIRLLYSRPVFDFSHPETLNWFARTVPPQRLSDITRLNISLGEAEVDFKTPSTQKAPFRVNNPTCRRARNDGDLLRYWDPAWRTILCDMIGLKHMVVTLFGHKYDDEKYAEPVLKPLLELRGLMTFKLVLQGDSKVGSEAARLESLQERSRTLQMILESATNEDDGGKRKAEDLDWGPPPPGPPRKKRRKFERNLYRY